MKLFVFRLLIASSFGAGLAAGADTHQWHPDAVWYNAKADQLNEAVSELSAAEICGKDTQDPLPACVPEHLHKAAELISGSTSDSESMVMVKTSIEEFSRNIQRNKNPVEYTYPVFSKNANPWFIALDKARKKFRQKAKSYNAGLSGLPNGSQISALPSSDRSVTGPPASGQNPR